MKRIYLIFLLVTSFSFAQFNPIFFYEAGKNRISNNLVAYYTLDSNTNESTGRSPNGTPLNIDYVSGKTGNAARFDAGTDKIDIADTNNLSFTDGTNDIPFSISMWVYFTAFNPSGDWLFNKNDNTVGGGEWQLVYYQSKFSFFKLDKATGGVNQTIGVSTPFSLNTWYFVTFTDDGSKTVAGMKIYINSVLQTATNISTGTYTGMANGTSITRIGLNAWGSAFANHQGYIEDIGVWKNRVLTQNEINKLYNSGNGITYPF